MHDAGKEAAGCLPIEPSPALPGLEFLSRWQNLIAVQTLRLGGHRDRVVMATTYERDREEISRPSIGDYYAESAEYRAVRGHNRPSRIDHNSGEQRGQRSLTIVRSILLRPPAKMGHSNDAHQTLSIRLIVQEKSIAKHNSLEPYAFAKTGH
jgi:hypothetical protein